MPSPAPVFDAPWEVRSTWARSRGPSAPHGGEPLRLRRQILPALLLAVSAAAFAYAVFYAWTAFAFPLELEVREGTSWLHALAKRAGVDIYDSRRVAFVNMIHGPVDPLLKGWIA